MIQIYRKKEYETDDKYLLHVTIEEGDYSETINGLSSHTGYVFKLIRVLDGYNKPSRPTYIKAKTGIGNGFNYIPCSPTNGIVNDILNTFDFTLANTDCLTFPPLAPTNPIVNNTLKTFDFTLATY